MEPAGDEIRIGRRAGVEIQLPFPTVSGLHARVFRQAKAWALVDMGSVNGTFVGDARLPTGTPRVIEPGTVFRLADVTIIFEGEVGAAAASAGGGGVPESTATLARRLVNDMFNSAGAAELARVIVASGPASGQSVTLALPDHAYKIGRSPDCDLVLPDDDVSREHATIERRWQGVFVTDLGSKNGIEIGGKRVRGDTRVHDGDVLTLGGTQLRIDDPEERYLRQVEGEASRAPAPSEAAPPPAAPAAPVAKPAPAPVAKPAPAAPAAAPVPAKSEAKAPAKPAPVAAKPKAPAVKPPPEPPAPGGASNSVLSFFVTIFALAVLGGVGFLAWAMFGF